MRNSTFKIFSFTVGAITYLMLYFLDKKYDFKNKFYSITPTKSALKFVLVVTYMIVCGIAVVVIGDYSIILGVILTSISTSLLSFLFFTDKTT